MTAAGSFDCIGVNLSYVPRLAEGQYQEEETNYRYGTYGLKGFPPVLEVVKPHGCPLLFFHSDGHTSQVCPPSS